MISAVFVSYGTGRLAVRAIESLREAAREESLRVEAIAVVNSGDEDEGRLLRGTADTVLLPPRNLGFSGGLNLGVDAARGDPIVLANPDVLVRSRALTCLSEVLARDPLAAAGPAYFWDEGETLLHPPVEEPRPAALLRARLAAEGRASVFRRDLRRAARAWRQHRRGETTRVTALRGAFVMTTRRALSAAGVFDEGYALYYEENDWQRRLRALGGRLYDVLAARVVHSYNQSARREPRVAAWFAASESRYYRSHFGERGARVLARAAEPLDRPAAVATPPGNGDLRFDPARAAAIVVSPVPFFHPFAMALPATGTASWSLPEDVRAGIHGTWYARAVDAETLEVLVATSISAPSGAA